MNVLKQCCYRSMRENRKRTVVTIIGIVLATALITAVACLAVSMRASLIAYEKQQNGDFHYHFLGVRAEYLKYFENNRQIARYGLVQELGYAILEESNNPDKPYLYLTAMDEVAESALALNLVEGRMPENGTELVIGRHVVSNGQVDLKLGDVLTLTLGNRISGEASLTQFHPYSSEEAFRPVTEKNYRVVGIVERPGQGVEPVTAPGYSAFTCLEDPGQTEKLDVYVTYTKQGLKCADQVNAGILGVSEELYRRWRRAEPYTEEEGQQIEKVAEAVQDNYWLLKWELMLFSSGVMSTMYAMSAIALIVIIVTSIICIRNSFVISLTEKMKLYGRLASVGTTSGQQRRIVYYEARFLSVIGIPLGVVSGLIATLILIKTVGFLVEDAMGFSLVFGFSVPMTVLAVILAAVTVFLSASSSARRAARISPISAIRANDTVNLGRGKPTCPKLIEMCFGIGGKIAYRNLKRARVKYRTTVVSIVVSVAIFIGMSTFLELLFFSANAYLESMPYQLKVSIFQWDYYGEALAITRMDGVEEAEIVRKANILVDGDQIPYTTDWRAQYEMEPEEESRIAVRTLGEEAYAHYCKRLGVSVEEARGKAIVLADYYWQWEADGKIHIEEGNIAEFKPGDVIRGTGEASDVEIEVLMQTKMKPLHLSSYNGILLIVEDVWLDSQTTLTKYDDMDVYVKCEDADEIEQRIRGELQLQYFTLENYNALYRSDQSMRVVLAIFLYGFITVVALIGITNIFNTITTNMELRAPEFAMLRSVGMTGKEFRRMIWLEGVFYGGKALCIGIPLGLLISLLFYRALAYRIFKDFQVSWMAILVSIGAVALLLYGIMHYSMGKINKKNIMDTIRNENI